MPSLQQSIGNEAIFLRGKDVCAQVEVVAFVVDELEGKHERSPWKSCLTLVNCEKQIPRSVLSIRCRLTWERGIPHFADCVRNDERLYALPSRGPACWTPTRATESVFAFEDEIGKREQRTCIFGVAMAVEAGFGAARVNEGQAARTVQSA